MPVNTLDPPNSEADKPDNGKRGRAARFVSRMLESVAEDKSADTERRLAAGIDTRDPYTAAADEGDPVAASEEAVVSSRASLETMGRIINSTDGVLSPDVNDAIQASVRNTGEIPVVGGDDEAQQIEVQHGVTPGEQ